MRRIILGLLMAAALLVTAGGTGCDDNVISDNARDSAAGFLTGIFGSAVDDAMNGTG